MSKNYKCTKCSHVYHTYNGTSIHTIKCGHPDVWTNKNTFSPKHIQYYDRRIGEGPLPTSPPWCPKKTQIKKEEIPFEYSDIKGVWDGEKWVQNVFIKEQIKTLNKNIHWHPLDITNIYSMFYTSKKVFIEDTGEEVCCLLHIQRFENSNNITNVYIYRKGEVK